MDQIPYDFAERVVRMLESFPLGIRSPLWTEAERTVRPKLIADCYVTLIYGPSPPNVYRMKVTIGDKEYFRLQDIPNVFVKNGTFFNGHLMIWPRAFWHHQTSETWTSLDDLFLFLEFHFSKITVWIQLLGPFAPSWNDIWRYCSRGLNIVNLIVQHLESDEDSIDGMKEGLLALVRTLREGRQLRCLQFHANTKQYDGLLNEVQLLVNQDQFVHVDIPNFVGSQLILDMVNEWKTSGKNELYCKFHMYEVLHKKKLQDLGCVDSKDYTDGELEDHEFRMVLNAPPKAPLHIQFRGGSYQYRHVGDTCRRCVCSYEIYFST